MKDRDIKYFTGHGRIEYNTPQWLFDALNMEFGFTVDGAASSDNAKCKRYWSKEDDALAKDWTDEVVFLNPPYGKGITTKWICKAYLESKKGATVVIVVPVRADAKWWHDYAMKGEVRLFRNRLNFANDHGANHYAPFATAIIVFRPYQYRLVSMPEVSLMGMAASNNRLQPTAFGVGTQAEFPLLGSSQAEESSAKNGGG
jgi:site-specific DNA-methyltransferase (adenine-specific)